jgi:anti-sigma regulatory factor (Ser/Thr protein kinase)
MTTMTVLGSLTLPGVDRSVACARRFVGEILGCDHPRLDDALVVTSEFVTNAITHSRSGLGGLVTIAVEGVPDQSLRISVIDDGADGAKPHVRDDLDAEDGRGLLIVSGLADDWGVDAGDAATTIWARLDFSAADGIPR